MSLMGSLHHQVAVLVPDEKLVVLISDKQFFSKRNEAAFIRDKYCHLEDDGSPLKNSEEAGARSRLEGNFGRLRLTRA